MGDVTLLVGDAPLLVGDVKLLVGDVTLLVGDVTLLVGDLALLVGDVSFPRPDAAELNDRTEVFNSPMWNNCARFIRLKCINKQ